MCGKIWRMTTYSPNFSLSRILFKRHVPIECAFIKHVNLAIFLRVAQGPLAPAQISRERQNTVLPVLLAAHGPGVPNLLLTNQLLSNVRYIGYWSVWGVRYSYFNNSPNFTSPRANWWAIRQMFPPSNLRSY